MTRAWCWPWHHQWGIWTVCHRRRFVLTSFRTGEQVPWGEMVDEHRTCQRCGKRKWRMTTRRT